MSFNTKHSSSHFQLFAPPEEEVENGCFEFQQEPNDKPLLDFVSIFPPELSDKLFSFVPIKDLMVCCQVSIKWRHVINNNRQWMDRCRKQMLMMKDDTTPLKWSALDTHVDSVALGFQRNESPAFLLPPIASSRIGRLCSWGRYFRQCLHLQRNWREGRNVIHKMNIPDDDGKVMNTFMSADTNLNILAVGTNSGCVYLWSLAGLPKLRKTIKYQSEVEQVRINENFLAILYQCGLVRAYKIATGFHMDKSKGLDLLLQFRVWGLPTPNIQHEYTLFCREVLELQIATPTDSSIQQAYAASLPNVEVNSKAATGCTEPLGQESLPSDADLLFETDYLTADMIFLITERFLVISGYACNCFLIFGFETKGLVKKVQVPQGVQACRNAIISPTAVYLTTKKMRTAQIFDPTISIFIYDLQEPWEFREFRSPDLTEEIRIDPKNPDKVIWIAQDSIIHAANLISQESIFVRSSEAYVDSIVLNGQYILYHQYDGFITALNWSGEVIYVTEALSGVARGFQAFGDFLVTGSDDKHLSVYDVHTGKLLHKTLHRPSRIEYLFIHETKIICIGRDEPAVLIGYW